MKPKNYKLPADAYTPTRKSPSETPEIIKEALEQFKDVDIASECVTYADDVSASHLPVYTGVIVTTEDNIKSALMITSPGYKNPDQNVYVGFIPCNIPVAFSAKEALELPYVSDGIAVQPGDGMLDRLRDAIQQSCADAHAFYIDGLLDLDAQLEL